jgi:hypothetical protein
MAGKAVLTENTITMFGVHVHSQAQIEDQKNSFTSNFLVYRSRPKHRHCAAHHRMYLRLNPDPNEMRVTRMPLSSLTVDCEFATVLLVRGKLQR